MDGQLLQQLYQACRALAQLGVHPSQIGIYPRAEQEQADEFFRAYFAGLRQLHVDLAGPLRGSFVVRPVEPGLADTESQAYGSGGSWGVAPGRQSQGAASEPLSSVPVEPGQPLASIFGPLPTPAETKAAPSEEETKAEKRRTAEAEARELDRRAEARDKLRREAEAEALEKQRLEAMTKPMDAEEILATANVVPPDEHAENGIAQPLS